MFDKKILNAEGKQKIVKSFSKMDLEKQKLITEVNNKNSTNPSAEKFQSF